jgi:hypothetical protein
MTKLTELLLNKTIISVKDGAHPELIVVDKNGQKETILIEPGVRPADYYKSQPVTIRSLGKCK